ncbi:MiaB/RimO family radical SAM methylthiotransferase [Candidatus Roizmanbacteria bacterium]|nr:MiaB/RimO family radical SAM methylthiotransferase [Candidatus Roizmanbacteria bacterium]
MKYFIKTFGCQQNKSDSQRIAASFQARGMEEAKTIQTANYIVINTCMVRRSAEDRVYGLVRNLSKVKEKKQFKLIVTGCMVGLAFRDKTGEYLQKIRERMPEVDEFMPIEEVGFDHEPLRQDQQNGWVPISNGCNNFCTFCVVPFTRGREISRPFDDIIQECTKMKQKGYQSITLLGQNVNSYGTDLILGEKNVQNVKPVYVKHLGKYRIPTLFPLLLAEVAKLGFENVEFISSNPWDFSDELINVIARYPNITRIIHLPIQSGDNKVLQRMNRWYTRDQYLNLISKLKSQISTVKFTTDIIVGFCGETDEEFQNTVEICKKVGFEKAYIAMYSQRPMTAAKKLLPDDVPHSVKKQRWLILENLINNYLTSRTHCKTYDSRLSFRAKRSAARNLG